MFDHQLAQQEAIADALQELISSEDCCDKAYDALVAAIDSWLNYYEDEAAKWKTLKRKVTASKIG